jgi:group I intron endonuclease
MKIGIYKIQSPSNKVYIGQSKNIDFRFKTYKKLQCKSQQRLYNSFLKYGYENHTKEILILLDEDYTQNQIDELERHFYNVYKEQGYKMLNIRECGQNGKHSETSKKKMSESGKNKIITQAHRDNMAKAQTGRRHSDETKKKMSQWQKGSITGKGRPILQYDENMNLIAEYMSVIHAARETGLFKQNITGSLKKNEYNPCKIKKGIDGQYKCGGYIWYYKK